MLSRGGMMKYPVNDDLISPIMHGARLLLIYSPIIHI